MSFVGGELSEKGNAGFCKGIKKVVFFYSFGVERRILVDGRFSLFTSLTKDSECLNQFAQINRCFAKH